MAVLGFTSTFIILLSVSFANAHDFVRVASTENLRQADLIVAIQPNYSAAECKIYFEFQENLADVTIEQEEIFARADVLVAEQLQTSGADITVIEDSRYSTADVRVYGTRNLILAAAACPNVKPK